MRQTILQAMNGGLIKHVEHLLLHIWDAKDIEVFEGLEEYDNEGNELDCFDLSFEGGVTRGARMTITNNVDMTITVDDLDCEIPNSVELYCGDAFFRCNLDTPCAEAICNYKIKPHVSEDVKRATIEYWWPYFRRNCYLMGFPIECTAHEKLEWTFWLKEKQKPIPIPPAPTQLRLWNAEELELIQNRFDAARGRGDLLKSILSGCSSYDGAIYIQ